MSEETEIQFNYDGINYVVVATYDTMTVDDSFDGHLGGYVYTFESSHNEVDPDTVEVLSCIGGPDNQDEDIDPDSIKGLMAYIIDRLQDQFERFL